MSYQVLARKWRPRNFQEMVGQQHVLRALVNALDHDRLHHAYLFTGTRGVGKTTVARILAKCLNCETGVSSQPCGECGSCLEIAEGRSVDLIEVDAASRTKVEDTRDLLDNVQYAPTRARFKIYLIDEVHMLSNHSFNALLKTLEEPPPHAKFLLATTDPQKLPATILSRCLQFNLKNMVPEQVVEHLTTILAEEKIDFESPALTLLGRAAAGSMRDALSLTDQAIAYGSGRLAESDVRDMLGTVDSGRVLDVLTAVSTGDAAAALECVSAIAEHAPDYGATLEEMISLLHRVTLAQMVPSEESSQTAEETRVSELAAQLSLDESQLY
ncbi:MAG: DNA polymerase III subunit gamma/tau, partial [Luminiphilus sp.]|nr:DNA polymerase III subunit gamma/tau [Luminiphilus sp.]